MTPPDSESEVAERLSVDDLREVWNLLVPEDRIESFRALARPDAEDLFLELSARDQTELLLALPQPERRSWVRLLPPDDAADLIQEAGTDHREALQRTERRRTHERRCHGQFLYEERASGAQRVRRDGGSGGDGLRLHARVGVCGKGLERLKRGGPTGSKRTGCIQPQQRVAVTRQLRSAGSALLRSGEH